MNPWKTIAAVVDTVQQAIDTGWQQRQEAPAQAQQQALVSNGEVKLSHWGLGLELRRASADALLQLLETGPVHRPAGLDSVRYRSTG